MASDRNVAVSGKLKIWNGGGLCCFKGGDPRWSALTHNQQPHAYVAARSRADARRVIEEYCGKLPADAYLRDYWSEGAWGIWMEGVLPERGLWLQFDPTGKPERVV